MHVLVSGVFCVHAHYAQDGGILTNNPCGVAIHEARLLWGKATPIQTIISLGTGLYRSEPLAAASGGTSSTSLKEKIIKVMAGATDTESNTLVGAIAMGT